MKARSSKRGPTRSCWRCKAATPTSTACKWDQHWKFKVPEMASSLPEPWAEGALPPNVRVGPNSIIAGAYAFKRFRSRLNPALVIGSHCTMDGTHFALGEEGRVEIGDYCYFTNAVLLCEEGLSIGNYV